MATTSDDLRKPAPIHNRDLEANFAYAEPSDTARSKRKLLTWADVKYEWQTGSKKRVVKHYVVSLLIGLLIGGIIGMAIGLAIRYTVGKH